MAVGWGLVIAKGHLLPPDQVYSPEVALRRMGACAGAIYVESSNYADCAGKRKNKFSLGRIDPDVRLRIRARTCKDEYISVAVRSARLAAQSA